MRVVRQCYICTDDSCADFNTKDEYIVHLHNASDQETINWFNGVFIKSYELSYGRFEYKCDYHWADEKGGDGIEFLAEDYPFALVKQTIVDDEIPIYSIQQTITKGEFFVDILRFGYNSPRFRLCGLEEYSEWLFK